MAKKLIGSVQTTIIAYKDGIDANLLDWVQDWNSNKTVIDLNSVITPKIFAGIKNSNGTITGIALGKYTLQTRNDSGTVVSQNIEGIYGFRDGAKTFSIDTSGDVVIGNKTQLVKYNAATGKIEFGTDVSLNWVNAANTALSSAKSYTDDKKSEAINAAASDATTKASNAKSEAISTASNDATNKSEKAKNDAIKAATEKINAVEIGGRNYALDTTNYFETKISASKKLDISPLFIEKIRNNPVTVSAYFDLDFVIGDNCHWGIDINVHFTDGTNQWINLTRGNNLPSNGNILLGYYHKTTIIPDKEIVRISNEYIFIRGAASIKKFIIKHVKVEIGNKPTDWTPAPEDIDAKILDAENAGKNAQAVADSITQKAKDEKWDTKLTYIDANGIFTGTLSANTVNAVKINASQITAGVIDVARINVEAIKSSIITASNIEALTLNVIRGKIGGWNIDSDSMYRGVKNNTINGYTNASGAITIGSNGIRGYKWRLEGNGSGTLAGGNISWDASGNVTFGASVSLNWTNAVNNALTSAKDYADSKKKEAIETASQNTNSVVNAIKLGGRNLVSNTNKGTSGWGYTVQTGKNVFSEVLALGIRACKSTCTEVSTGYHVICRNINRSLIKNNTQYTLSFDILCDFDTTMGVRIVNSNGLNSLVIFPNTSILKNIWKRVELTAITNDDTTTNQVIYITGFNAIGSVIFANMQLEEGNKASVWSPSVEDLNGDITAAKNAADNAQTSANTANTKLTEIANDNLLTPSEKQDTLKEWQIIQGEFATVKAQATTYGIATTSYETAYNNLNSYITPLLSNLTVNNTISGTDFRSKFKAYYDAKIALLKLITDKAKSLSDAAQNSIDNLKVGGNNLLNNSGNWKTAGWNNGFGSNGGGYTIDNTVLFNGLPTVYTLVGAGLSHSWIKLENNVEYTFSAIVLCNETIAGAGNVPLHLQAGLNNTSQGKLTHISYDTSVVANVWKKIHVVFKITGDANSARPFFHRGANGTTKYWIAYLKLEKGNIATDWQPSSSDLRAEIKVAETAGTNAQAVADAITKKANDEKWATKLTYIDGTGIFTGTLSANTVNALKINASQITAGVIDTARINVGELKSSLITAENIEALTLNVAKGKIGGWNIQSDHISIGALNNSSSTPIQIRTTTIGTSGQVYAGQIKPYGITLSWLKSGNAGHFIMGQVTSGGTAVKTGFIGIQMMAWDGTEYFCLSANHQKENIKEVYNRIAGWAFDSVKIWKNNVSLGSDGSIQNGTKWQINNDGSGRIASGNIVWDASGNVTFGSSVSLNWTNAANNALTSAKSYADSKKSEAINAAASDATTKTDAAKELAQAMAFGKMLYRDPTFHLGYNSIMVYNNTQNGTVTVTRTSDTNAPNDSKYVLVIKNTGSSTPNCGGFNFATASSYRKILISRIIAKIPVGRNINFHTNSFGTGGAFKWLTPTAGTGDWCEYICKVSCGTANFSTTNFFAIDGAVGTASAPVEWRVAYATVFDVTSSEKYTTTIDANGIYTSTLNASQINAGTINADRIAAGSLNASKLDAASIKASIVNTDYINGLTLNFVRGKIGGWNIGSDAMAIGTIGGVGAMPIQLRSTSVGSGYVYNGAYKPYGLTMTWHQSQNAGHLVFGQVMANGTTPKTGFMGLQMMNWMGAEYFTLSTNYTKSGSIEVYNRIAGWGFDNTRIWKNNVSLGADGSIQNSTKWQLNNDGSGRVANGNIVWDANGTVTFGSSVSLNWTNAATNALNSAKTYTDGKVNDITIGGRNYAQNTSCNWSVGVVLNNVLNQCILGYKVLAEDWKAGDTICISFDYLYTDITKFTSANIVFQGGGNSTGYTNGFSGYAFHNLLDYTAGSGIIHVHYKFTVTAAQATNDFFSVNIRHDYVLGKVAIRNLKIEKGTKPTEWSPAPEDIENRLTKITATGIYTGEIAANQIKVDSVMIVGGNSYNGSISVRDASNVVKVTLDRNGINAVGGTIGGWAIATNQISKNGIVLGADGSITNGTKWKLNNDGSGQLANGNITWNTAGSLTMTGTINATSGTIGGFTISGNSLKNSAGDTSLKFDKLSGSSFLYINDTSTLLAMRADSARTGISISTYATGAIGLKILANTGSTSAIESFGPHTFGQRPGERWCAPGVLYAAICKYSTLYNTWGNGLRVTSFQRMGTGNFKLTHNLGHTQYIVVATPYWDHNSNWHSNCFIRVEYLNANDVVMRVVNADNAGYVDTCFSFAIIGRNQW